MEEARRQDEELAKKIRKTEKDERKKGVVALGMQDTKKVLALKRQRPEIWEEPARTLEKLVAPIKRLKEFTKEECAPDKTASFARASALFATGTSGRACWATTRWCSGGPRLRRR